MLISDCLKQKNLNIFLQERECNGQLRKTPARLMNLEVGGIKHL